MRVLIVSSNPLARIGLAALLTNVPDIELVGEVSDYETIAEQAEESEAEVLLWDVGWEVELVIESLNERDTALPPIIVLLASAEDAGQIRGVEGVLSHESTLEQLLGALAAAAAGLVVLDPTIMPQAILPTPSPQLDAPLTGRELEVLHHLASGLPNKLIAHELGVSEHTVKFHIKGIFKKLGVQSRTEAVTRAMKLGLLSI